MKNNRPKLYALLLQYLSDESLDEVKWSDKFEKVDQETDLEGLWQIIEETHKVSTVSKVQSVMKKAARATYCKQLIILTTLLTSGSPTRRSDSTPSFHPMVGIRISGTNY